MTIVSKYFIKEKQKYYILCIDLILFTVSNKIFVLYRKLQISLGELWARCNGGNR